MGKILDDKKRLDDYINYYQKDLFSNNKSNTLINDNRNEYQSDKNKDMSNKNISNDCNENIIPITIHVKITEKCNSIKGGEYINAASNYSCMYCEEMFSYNFDYKTFNTVLAQLSIIMFVTLLWLYRYNHGESFPAFSLIHYFMRTWVYINEKKEEFFLRREARNNNTNAKEN
ncbi:conserved Plasmodium protein, unknown function [Plasmodium malariae]|uniref:Uncharacterized protein n=1 Tax=Plasmodium malariae TaxID=5858 RepID=A0A1A8X4M3_PLAMA|nr:conserved Plasmodium protein, unknown function [Plasmodium malariae]